MCDLEEEILTVKKCGFVDERLEKLPNCCDASGSRPQKGCGVSFQMVS